MHIETFFQPNYLLYFTRAASFGISDPFPKTPASPQKGRLIVSEVIWLGLFDASHSQMNRFGVRCRSLWVEAYRYTLFTFINPQSMVPCRSRKPFHGEKTVHPPVAFTSMQMSNVQQNQWINFPKCAPCFRPVGWFAFSFKIFAPFCVLPLEFVSAGGMGCFI